MTAAQAEIPVLSSIAEIGANYKVWLVDIWGVMHDGLRAHPRAVEATKAFREQAGIVILLSNSPRPSREVQAQLLSLGVPDDAYDATVTSGDLTRYELEKRSGARVFHLGPERDRPIFSGLKLSLTEPEQAQIIVCTGLFDDETETPEDYDRLLKDLAKRGLPMICANPDRMVERGKQLIYCAGALADRYAADGGSVIYAGKPYAPVYALAFEAASKLAGREVAPEEVLGDWRRYHDRHGRRRRRRPRRRVHRQRFAHRQFAGRWFPPGRGRERCLRGGSLRSLLHLVKASSRKVETFGRDDASEG